MPAKRPAKAIVRKKATTATPRPAKKVRPTVNVQPAPGSDWVAVNHPDDVPAYPLGTALYFVNNVSGDELHQVYLKVAPDTWVHAFSYTERESWKQIASQIANNDGARRTDNQIRLEKFLVLSEGWKVRPYVVG